MEEITDFGLSVLAQQDAGYGFSGSGGANLGYTAKASTNPMDFSTYSSPDTVRANGSRKNRLSNRFAKKGANK